MSIGLWWANQQSLDTVDRSKCVYIAVIRFFLWWQKECVILSSPSDSFVSYLFGWYIAIQFDWIGYQSFGRMKCYQKSIVWACILSEVGGECGALLPWISTFDHIHSWSKRPSLFRLNVMVFYCRFFVLHPPFMSAIVTTVTAISWEDTDVCVRPTGSQHLFKWRHLDGKYLFFMPVYLY